MLPARAEREGTMFQLLRWHHRAPIVGQSAHRCVVCDTGGPFAWLAYRGRADRRRPVAWLCLYCLELGHSPDAFAASTRARHPDARFAIFPGTSIEQERALPPPAGAGA